MKVTVFSAEGPSDSSDVPAPTLAPGSPSTPAPAPTLAPASPSTVAPVPTMTPPYGSGGSTLPVMGTAVAITVVASVLMA
jgi:hypothetical protein